ncbi:MAG: hypothetical protein PVJ64_14330 [Gemmatimonadales bacterium]
MSNGTNDYIYEEISYHLEGSGIYVSDDIKSRITETLMRLPERPREYALDNCFFLGVGYGMCVGTSIVCMTGREVPPKKFLVVVRDEIPDDDVHSVIAHEIAHAWLGHDMGPNVPQSGEVEAAKLVAEWGFTGIGADVGLYEKQARCAEALRDALRARPTVNDE